MEKEDHVASVTGTTAIVKKMVSHKVSPKNIVETLIPVFTEKGISESLPKRRIGPLIHREQKKREKK